MRKYSLVLVFAFILSFAPIVMYAALVPCNGPDCTPCHVAQLAQNILTFLIEITVILAGIAFAIAGLMMVTAGGNMGQVEKAKGVFTNVAIGLIILLAAWLIVDTVMKLFVDQSKLLQPWNQIQCTVPSGAATTQAPATKGAIEVSALPGDQYGNIDATSYLLDNGIAVSSSGNCNNRNDPTCTSLDGVKGEILNQVVRVADACPDCNIHVTAGTEMGHTNPCHVSGTCVDINCVGGCSTEQINTILSTSAANGSKAVYEVKTTAEKNALVGSGVASDNIEVVSWASAPHFSLYLNRQISLMGSLADDQATVEPAKKTEISYSISGHELTPLTVNVLDGEGNIVESIFALDVSEEKFNSIFNNDELRLRASYYWEVFINLVSSETVAIFNIDAFTIANYRTEGGSEASMSSYDGDKWVLKVYPLELDHTFTEEERFDELIATYVHEFAHALTMNVGQLSTQDKEDCSTFYVKYGCLREGSYLYNFYLKFWKTKDANAEDYVSDYAQDSIEEDIAESFLAFTGLGLKDAPDSYIVNQKMHFFSQYPEFVALKNNLIEAESKMAK